MGRFGKAAAAAGLAIALVLGGSVSANANDTSTVDYGEFDAARLGHSLAQVQSNFDSSGAVVTHTSTYLAKKYRSAEGSAGVDVFIDYGRSNGVWTLAQKTAFWGWTPNPAHNPSTKSEYLAIKAGMTVPQVRSIIGSYGTRAFDNVSKYGSVREYVWPTSTSANGVAVVRFKVKNGTFVVTGKTAIWD